MTKEELASMFDHTFLKAYASRDDFIKLCDEAKDIGATMVAINSEPVKLCKELLKGTSIHVGAAISFPLGQTTLDIKLAETKQAIDDGADEIDYVIPGNDDAIRAIKLIASIMANAVLEGKQGKQDAPAAEEAAKAE